MATHSSILAGKSHAQRSLVGYSPWGHTDLDSTEATKQQQQHAGAVITYLFWNKFKSIQNCIKIGDSFIYILER